MRRVQQLMTLVCLLACLSCSQAQAQRNLIIPQQVESAVKERFEGYNIEASRQLDDRSYQLKLRHPTRGPQTVIMSEQGEWLETRRPIALKRVGQAYKDALPDFAVITWNAAAYARTPQYDNLLVLDITHGEGLRELFYLNTNHEIVKRREMPQLRD